MEIVSFRNVSFRYNSEDIISNINLSLNSGEYIGLIGPNGSGKTTFVKLILGIIKPDRGEIYLYGKRFADFKDWQLFGYLPQKIMFFDPYFPASVREIVATGLLPNKKLPRRFQASDDMLIDETLSMFGITDIMDKQIGKLSGGEQQRVMIARAMVGNPHILILDEPVAAVDPEFRENFYGILNNLNRVGKKTIILISHDAGAIGGYVSRFLYLDKKVVFLGTPDEFCNSDEMKRYFGESQHVICHSKTCPLKVC